VNDIAIVILAAGSSSRLGRPKQLVQRGGRSLLRRAAEAALGVGCGPVFVVLGAHRDEVVGEVAGLDVHLVENDAWPTGMASSIRAAVGAMMTAERAGIGAMMLMPCDLPGVDAASLSRLVGAFRPGDRPMAAAAYDGTIGTPAIFDRSCFDALQRLSGDEGARRILRASEADVVRMAMPEAAYDVDTPADAD
jgi:molybdenum cofactor cytidylyltransferase